MSLAKVFRVYLGLESNLTEEYRPFTDGLLYSDIRQIPLNASSSNSADMIAGKFAIEEPISIAEATKEESHLPSTKLYSVPFPDSDIPNLFIPNYLRQNLIYEPYPILPDYKPPRNIIPNIKAPRNKRKKNKYYRRRRR